MKKILLAFALMMPLSAMAQNIIMDTNTQMLTQSMMASANEPSRPKPPVTRNAPAVKYVQTDVRANGERVYMLDDLEKRIKCYWIQPYNEPQNLSCVKY